MKQPADRDRAAQTYRQSDSKLHDRATYRYYWQLLQKAKSTGVAVPEEAAEAFF